MWLAILSMIGGLLACICIPFYGIARRKGGKWERFLEDQAQAVRDVAMAAREKPGGLALREIPGPVHKFFERALRDDYPRPFRLWTARTIGQLRFGKGSRWMDIDATTVAAVGEPAFCYTGTLKMGPGLWCRGREGYLGGKGGMEWKLWGALTLARQEGPHLDQCALVRYLAEGVCFPAALLPSAHLKWVASPTDPEHCARAMLSWAGAVVSATFTFDSFGRVKELRTNDYYREVAKGRVVRTPWFARMSGYTRFGLGSRGGIEVPTNLEVGWLEPDGSELVYGRFTLARVHGE